ncbi:hypothetical protein [Pseudanabaena cinerea]|nr:hypothetical protein [Pseudanabaena cinerea]
MSDQELREIGLFKTLIGKDEKFFPTDEALDALYQAKTYTP